MKEIIPILLIGMLVFSGLGAVALDSDEKQFEYKIKEIENTENGDRDFTHTVLAEYAANTSCILCKHAHAALKNIYASGDYPFYYVSLVSDKNPGVCNPRLAELNIPGYPDVYFDGGYIVEIGGYTGNEADYRVAIPACGNRAVYDVDVNLDVTWLGGTNMQINASVDNNEGSTYDGTIRVYITEIISSMNWKDTAGQLYTFPLLDYAFKDDGTGNDISISAGGTWSDSTTWDGTAHGFSSITRDNIMVIAAVFNDDWHQGYAYPPSNNPFDAYYVDDTIGTTPGGGSGGPPNKPNPPSGPTSGVIDVEYTYTGSTTDPDGDDIYYLFDWGDGTDSGWLGPYPSGTLVEASHTWTYADTFGVRLKAKDTMDGPWSDPLSVEITGPRIEIGNIDGGLLKVGTVIQNDGDIELTDVNWKLTLAGGAFIGKETTGEGLTVPANGEATISSGLIFGFRPTEITVEAWIQDGPSDMRQQDGFVFLFFVKVNPGGGI